VVGCGAAPARDQIVALVTKVALPGAVGAGGIGAGVEATAVESKEGETGVSFLQMAWATLTSKRNNS
jgi:hypothetical protein